MAFTLSLDAPQAVMHLVDPVIQLWPPDAAFDGGTQRCTACPTLQDENGAAHLAGGVAVVAADAQHVCQVAVVGWVVSRWCRLDGDGLR